MDSDESTKVARIAQERMTIRGFACTHGNGYNHTWQWERTFRFSVYFFSIAAGRDVDAWVESPKVIPGGPDMDPSTGEVGISFLTDRWKPDSQLRVGGDSSWSGTVAVWQDALTVRWSCAWSRQWSGDYGNGICPSIRDHHNKPGDWWLGDYPQNNYLVIRNRHGDPSHDGPPIAAAKIQPVAP